MTRDSWHAIETYLFRLRVSDDAVVRVLCFGRGAFDVGVVGHEEQLQVKGRWHGGWA